MKASPQSNEGMPNAAKTLITYPKYFEHSGWEEITH
jgi:hypothetical protein